MKTPIAWPRIVAVAVALLLAACQPANIAPDKVAGIRRVAVLSLVGHELNQVYIGLTVFGNEREKHDIRSWNLDAALEEQAAAELRKTGRFEAVAAQAERQPFRPVYAGRSGPINPALLEPDWAAIGTLLRALAERTRADVILVVLTAPVQDPIGRSPQSLEGLGIYARGIGDSTHIAAAHVLAMLYAVEASTLKTLAAGGLVSRKVYPNGTWDNLPMWAPIDRGIARTPFPQWNEAQKAEVRERLLEVAGRSWAISLKELIHGR